MDQPQSKAPPHRPEEGLSAFSDTTIASLAGILLEASRDLIALADPDGRVVAFNAVFQREFAQLAGHPPIPGQPLDRTLAPFTGDPAKAESWRGRVLQGESFRVVECVADNASKRRKFAWEFRPMPTARRHSFFAAVIGRDLMMPSAADERLDAMMETVSDGVIILGASDRIDLANAKAESIFGYNRGQMLGLPLDALLPKRFSAARARQRKHVDSPRPRPAGRCAAGLRADGVEFPIDMSLNPIDIDDEPVTVCVIRDLPTSRHTADPLRNLSVEPKRRTREQIALMEQTIRDFRTTFEQAAIGIAHIALDGRWLRMNQTLCDFLGYSSDEMLSQALDELAHPDDLGHDQSQRERLFAGDIAAYSMEMRYRHKRGHWVWTHRNVSLVRDLHGISSYFIVVLKDIEDRKRAEAELKSSKQSLEFAIKAAGLGLFDYRPQTGELIWSPETKRHFGLAPDAAVDFELFRKGVHPDDRDRVEKVLRQGLHSGAGFRCHVEYRTVGIKDHKQRWIEAWGQVCSDVQGDSIQFIGATLDITEKKRFEESLRKREQQLRMILEANPIGTARRTAEGCIIEANSAFLRLIGRDIDELRARRIRWHEMTPPEFQAIDRQAMCEARESGVSSLHEKEYLRADGVRVPVLFAFASLGSRQDLIVFALDISERKAAEERVRQTALHDPLTGLPNRALLFEYAKHLFAGALRDRSKIAVAYIDLDQFKPINDTYGHETGDALLAEVARRLSKCTRSEDIVSRLGGDEFLVLLPGVEDDVNASEAARHILLSVNRPYTLNGLELSLSSSIGIALFPRDGQDIDALINHADTAMYQAKQTGRNNFQFYSAELADRSRLHADIEHRLKATLSNEAFSLHFQPVVDIQTASLASVEALLRWPHDDVGPDRFIPIAETAGLINRVGDWVISQACRQHRMWRSHGLPSIPVAVNISAVQFRQKEFAERFIESIRECEADTCAVQLELTETVLMENIDAARGILTQLQSAGVKIALDDFGTGYSSLNYLSRLPIDKIKVDQSFVKRLEYDQASRAIIDAIIALGRTLKLEIVAEGIESEYALRYLRAHGCHQAQGFHVCRPITAMAFESWYRHHSGMNVRLMNDESDQSPSS